MKFKNAHKDPTKIDCLTMLIEKNFSFFSFVYQIISKKPTNFISPNSAQTFYFPLKDTTSLMFATQKNDQLFADILHTHFLSEL